jgi:hypothetical protein
MRLVKVIFIMLGVLVASNSNAALTGPFAFDGHDYYVVTNCQNWQQAEDQALGLGGHLVSISDSDENDFVASIIPWGGGWWTGLSDQVSEGNWVWTDGSPTTFFSWNMPYEPNGGTGENCVEMGNSGAWNDLPCDRCIGAILEVPAVPAVICAGFEPPMADHPVTVKKNRALPLKALVFDADGFALSDADFTVPPVVQVLFDAGTGGDPVDVTDEVLSVGLGTEGNQFVFTDEGYWQFNLKTKNYTAPGTYIVTMETGDDAEYVFDPACMTEFVIQ